MSLTFNQIQALYKLYPQAINTVDNVAYDAEGNELIYDIEAVNAKVASDEQTEVAAKESALSKLTALGLTADEVKALLGVSA
jgi:hypothetical protein